MQLYTRNVLWDKNTEALMVKCLELLDMSMEVTAIITLAN